MEFFNKLLLLFVLLVVLSLFSVSLRTVVRERRFPSYEDFRKLEKLLWWVGMVGGMLLIASRT